MPLPPPPDPEPQAKDIQESTTHVVKDEGLPGRITVSFVDGPLGLGLRRSQSTNDTYSASIEDFPRRDGRVGQAEQWNATATAKLTAGMLLTHCNDVHLMGLSYNEVIKHCGPRPITLVFSYSGSNRTFNGELSLERSRAEQVFRLVQTGSLDTLRSMSLIGGTTTTTNAATRTVA